MVNSKLNTRQHRFILNLLAGMNQEKAYVEAGYLPQGAAECASRMLTVAKVSQFLEAKKAEIANKTTEAIEQSIMQPTEIKQRLTKLARANLVDFTKDGQPNLDKDTPNNEAATEYYHKSRLDHNGNPVVTRNIKLVNPIEPLRELIKIHGMYSPDKHLTVSKVQFEVNFIDKRKQEDT